MKTIKAISLHQPWATLCVIAHPNDYSKSIKGYETRSWSTRNRGLVLIHAAKKKTKLQQEIIDNCPIIRQAFEFCGYHSLDDLPFGAIVGSVHLTECISTDIAYEYTADHFALAMGDYGPGRYAWKLEKPKKWASPVPWIGRQGFFKVPVDDIRRQSS